MPPTEGVPVSFGGREYTLRYTWPALRKLQNERNGEGLGQTLMKASQIAPDAITALVWAGLLHEHRDMKIGDVYDLIEPPLPELVNKCVKALEPWMGDADEGKANGAGGG